MSSLIQKAKQNLKSCFKSCMTNNTKSTELSFCYDNTRTRNQKQNNYHRSEENLIQDLTSIEINEFPILITTPEKSRYLSPVMSDIQNQDNLYFECDTNQDEYQNHAEEYQYIDFATTKSEYESQYSVGVDSNDSCFQTVLTSNESQFKTEESIFVCRISYTAQTAVEMSIEFSDRLKIIKKEDDGEFCLVKNSPHLFLTQ